MSLTAKETSGKGFDPIPEGVYQAICYSVIDLGTHHDDRFKKDIHKVLIQWEIPGERIEIERDGKMLDLPRAISKRYTMSLHKKSSLRHDLEAWRGRRFSDAELAGFDLSKVAGSPCLLAIVHTEKADKTYADIASIMAPPRGDGNKYGRPENPVTVFEIPDGQNGPFDIPDVPEWVADTIRESMEYQGAIPQPVTMPEPIEEGPPAEDGDELPF